MGSVPNKNALVAVADLRALGLIILFVEASFEASYSIQSYRSHNERTSLIPAALVKVKKKAARRIFVF